MILTCPNCATRYFVDDSRLGAAGRTVRCASCGERWRASPEETLELSSSPEEGAVAQAPIERLSPDTIATAHDTPAEALPKVFRERAQTRRKVREAATSGVIWAAAAGVIVLVVGLVVVLRQDIARLWPRTAGVYAMIGLPVNLVGLAIEDQHARPALNDGHAAVIVTGALRNVRDKPVAAPRLRISLLNPAGRPLMVKIVDPGQALIPPGEARHFIVNLLDPPVSATDVDVAFVLNDVGRRPRIVAPAPASSKFSLRGATGSDPPTLPQGPTVAPVNAPEVTPLPATSPYALPPVHGGADDPHG